MAEREEGSESSDEESEVEWEDVAPVPSILNGREFKTLTSEPLTKEPSNVDPSVMLCALICIEQTRTSL